MALDVKNRFVWVDLEMTGLDPKAGIPLELGFVITDLDLNWLHAESWVLYEKDWEADGHYQARNTDPLVWTMHEKSGLWDDVGKIGQRLEAVTEEASYWLQDHGVTPTDPMCGSSVQTDRLWIQEWFYDCFARFSYRNVDVSTVKELMRRFSPDIFADMEKCYPHAEAPHRALGCLANTLAELKFYLKEFLYVPADFQ